MLAPVGTNDFDIHEAGPRVSGDLLPLTPRQLERIARIGGNRKPQTKIVCRDPVSETIALTLHVDRAQIPERLLNGVDAEIESTKLLRNPSRQLRFPAAWQPRKYKQNCLGPPVQAERQVINPRWTQTECRTIAWVVLSLER